MMLLTGPLRAQTCGRQDKSESLLQQSDSAPVSSLLEAETSYNKMYESGRRIRRRFYFNRANFKYVAPGEAGAGEITIPREFVHIISGHIRFALERGYANFAYYPDMGHVHLLMRNEKMLESANAESIDIESMLKSDSFQLLYHTAELFNFRSGTTIHSPMVDNQWLQWRYYFRNIIAEARNTPKIVFAEPGQYNTVRSVEEYSEVATLYFSASKDGCFSFQHNGKNIRFDLSFYNPMSRDLGTAVFRNLTIPCKTLVI